MMKQFARQTQQEERFQGIAAVEMALGLPVLVLMLLGTIDMGQFMSVGQVISNTSRVAARKASQFDTKSVSEVETEVSNYLDNYFTQRSASALEDATTVTVALSDGTAISGTALGDLETGQKFEVTVAFDYSAVRWLSGIGFLDNRAVSFTTTIRRF